MGRCKCSKPLVQSVLNIPSREVQGEGGGEDGCGLQAESSPHSCAVKGCDGAVKGCGRCPARCFCAASGREVELCSFLSYINPSSAAAPSCSTCSWVFQSEAGKYSQELLSQAWLSGRCIPDCSSCLCAQSDKQPFKSSLRCCFETFFGA